jgi:hypothetical protein
LLLLDGMVLQHHLQQILLYDRRNERCDQLPYLHTPEISASMAELRDRFFIVRDASCSFLTLEDG